MLAKPDYIGAMKYSRLAFLLVVLGLFAGPATAEKLTLRAISGYLNEIVTAQAEFTQINDDGSIATGKLSMLRPGRIRFDYNPPDESLVLASQGQVAIFDSKSNQTPEKFPLARTPLSIILGNTVNLEQAKMVVGHSSDGTTTTVVAQDPKHPDYGDIQLVFTGQPVELRQWIITDGSGQKTTVILGSFLTEISLSPRLFDITEELKKRGF